MTARRHGLRSWLQHARFTKLVSARKQLAGFEIECAVRCCSDDHRGVVASAKSPVLARVRENKPRRPVERVTNINQGGTSWVHVSQPGC